MKNLYDYIVVGSGVSGGFWCLELVKKGYRVLLLEAGDYLNKHTYPRSEIDANSKLYWSGGIEFNNDVSIGLLRPKVVGGGSIVNQALLDRFDDDAWESWQKKSGLSSLNAAEFKPYYDRIEESISFEEIPAEYNNKNADVFREGFEANGYQWGRLVRAQKDCKFAEGNDCIECLAGCRIDSKQSSAVTTIEQALKGDYKGSLELIDHCEVQKVIKQKDLYRIEARENKLYDTTYMAKKIVLASGAIGNTKILKMSGFQNPNIGKHFYTHPQFMVLGLYKDKIQAHKGPLQSLKSADADFRKQGFKLENVFAPPVGISMLIPEVGKKLHKVMNQYDHMGCVEVCVRDVTPGTISVNSKGKVSIDKKMGKEDLKRKEAGLDAISKIFKSTGAKEIIEGRMSIGLHLMGGCCLGENPRDSVVDEKFCLHEDSNIMLADSSVFPNAPGINPSMTIMALTLKASSQIQDKAV